MPVVSSAGVAAKPLMRRAYGAGDCPEMLPGDPEGKPLKGKDGKYRVVCRGWKSKLGDGC